MILNIEKPFVINGNTKLKIKKPKLITITFTFKIKPMTIYLMQTESKGTTAIAQAFTLEKAKQLFIEKFGYLIYNHFKKEIGYIKAKRIGYTDFKTGKAFKEKIIFIN